MNRRRSLFLLTLLLAAGWLPGAGPRAAGAQQGVSAVIRPLTLRPRSRAPVLLEVRLKLRNPGLREGRLVVDVQVGGEVTRRWRSPPLALTESQQSFTFALPALLVAGYGSRRADLVCRYLTADGPLPVENWFVQAPGAEQRWLVTAFCLPPDGTGGSEQALRRHFRLESYSPEASTDRGVERNLLTTQPLLAPEELPSTPLAYCSFDLVVLVGRAFAALEATQLSALSEWVRMGGAVCLLPDRASLGPRHLAFLRALGEDGGAAFERDGTGRLRLSAADGAAAGPLLLECGLGRAAVQLGSVPAAEELNRPAWRRAAGFLWRLRAPHGDAVAESGAWDDDRRTAFVQEANQGRLLSWEHSGMGYGRYGSVTPRETGLTPLQVGGALEALLTPEGLEMVPLWAVAGLLGLFLLCIGPGDWYLLGRLRRRGWTWILFPALSLGFFAFSFWLAEYFLGVGDHQRSLVILDVEPSGRVLRRTRLTLHYPDSSRKVVREGRRAILDELEMSRFGASRDHRRRLGRRRRVETGGEEAPPVYVGRFPLGYEVHARVRQWDPVVLRSTAPGGGDVVETDPWGRLDEVGWGRRDWRKRLAGLLAPGQSAVVFAGRNSPVPIPHRGVVADLRRGGLLRGLCARPPAGIFSLVSRISPTGAPDFEDLTLLDADEPQTAVLAVAQRRGGDIILTRCLLRRWEATSGPQGTDDDPPARVESAH